MILTMRKIVQWCLLAAVPLTLLAAVVRWQMNRGNAERKQIEAAFFVPPPASKSRTARRERKKSHELLQRGLKDSLPPPGAANASSAPSDDDEAASPFEDAPEGCAERWRGLAESSFAEIVTDIRDGILTAAPSCTETEQDMVGNAVPKVDPTLCLTILAAGETAPGQRECQSWLLYLRAGIIDRLFTGNSPSEWPVPVLANKLLVTLPEAFTSPEARARAMSMVDVLIEKEPDLYAGYKARAVLSFLEPGPDGKPNPDSPRFLAAFDSCREFGVNDPELDEVAFLRHAVRENSEAMLDEARQVLAENPRSAIGHYYLASEAFKAGRREEAIKLLRTASELAPSDERIKQTLAKAATAAANEKIFQSKLTVSFDDESL